METTNSSGKVAENIEFFDIDFFDLVEAPAFVAGRARVWVAPEEQRVVGEVLAEFRKAGGLRQQDVAARLGKPQSFVSAYEAGQRRIDVLELIKIADAIGIGPDTVFAAIAARYRPS